MIIKFIQSKTVFIWSLIALGFIVWFNALNSIPKEENPSISLPKFVINTFYFWGDPKTIEKEITEKLEDEFKSITWIKKISSVSGFNVSTVIVDFYDNKGRIEAKSDLKDKIDKVSGWFPIWTQTSVVTHINPDDTPVYSFAVTGDLFARDLYDRSKGLEDNFKWIKGVSDVIVIWEPDKKINVFVDYNKMNRFWISLDSVVGILKWTFVSAPSDKKSIDGSLYSYEIVSYEKNIPDIVERLYNKDIVNLNSQSIKLRDIANITYEEISLRQKAFFDQNNNNTNAISFNIKVSPGTDVESVIKQVLEYTDDFAAKNSDLQVVETFSKLLSIDDMFDTFLSNFWQTGVLILIILIIFIGSRLALGVGIAFPLAYFFTFIYLSFVWYTFNTIVSFSLVLSLWIMVDNLIVVSEWISKELKKWIWFWTAYQNTLDTYLWSIVAWTLTTIAIFLPINFMVEWMVWQFIAPLSITITGTLIASLFVSLLLLPVILSKILWKGNVGKETKWSQALSRSAVYISKLTEKVLQTKKKMLLVIVSFWALLFFAFSLVWSGVIKNDFLPATDEENAWVNIKYSAGTSLPKNQEYTNIVIDSVKQYLDENFPEHVRFIEINIWNLYSTDAATSASNPTADNQAYLNLRFVDEDQRENLSFEVVESLQKYLNANIKSKYDFISDIYTVSWVGLAWWKPVWFYIIWKDLEQITAYIKKIRPEVENITWVFNVTTNLEYTNGTIRYLIDTNKAQRNNLDPSSVVQLLSSLKNSDYLPNGLAITNFSDVADEQVNLNLFTNYQGNVEDLKIWENFVSKITEKKEILPQLKNIAHLDGNLQVIIESDKEAATPLWGITQAIDQIIKTHGLPEWLSFRYNDNISDQNESMWGLWAAFWTGFLLMLLILIFQFNSFKYAIIVMTSTFLSIIWAIFTLGLLGLPLSFPAQLWLFGVIWVWVNNAILFIDTYISEMRKNTNLSSQDLKTLLVETVQHRFSPIFLTSLTTIAWLVTLALKDALWWSLAIAFIGWLLLNIFMVIVYLPSILYLTEKKNK